MKICIPLTNLTFEGNVVFDLAKALAKHGHDVKILAPGGRGLAGEETVEGVKIKRFRYFWPVSFESLAYGYGIVKNLRRNPLKILLLPFFFSAFCVKILRESGDCDVIHANWLPSALASLPAKMLMGKPVVLTVHGTDVRHMPGWLIRVAVKTSDAITTSHEELVGKVEHSGGKIEIVRNMLDFRAFENPRGARVEKLRREFSFWNKPVVLFVGRFISERDPVTFIKAAKDVEDTNFVMVGDGELFEDAKSFARRNSVKNVFFTGRRNDVGAFMKLCDVFVSTSNFDNVFSTSVIEAMVAGKPMALTDAGKTSKFFKSENAVLFRVGNAGELAGAVREIISNPAKAVKMSVGNKAFAKKLGFDEEKIIEKNVRIYKSLLE